CTKGAAPLRRKQMATTRRTARVCARARVVGVAFFDFFQGQTGVAPNAIELHPVLGFACLSSAGYSQPPPPPSGGSAPPHTRRSVSRRRRRTSTAQTSPTEASGCFGTSVTPTHTTLMETTTESVVRVKSPESGSRRHGQAEVVPNAIELQPILDLACLSRQKGAGGLDRTDQACRGGNLIRAGYSTVSKDSYWVRRWRSSRSSSSKPRRSRIVGVISPTRRTG